MKRLLTMLLIIAMLFSMAACGADDPNAGVYNAVSCTALGFELDCEGDWLELKKGGKAELCLMGEEYFCSWTLEAENFTLKNHGDEFSGTLQNGIITLDYGDMIYVYVMDGVVTEAGETLGHTHSWQDADCENSKTCTDCGETEGEALGHDGTEANYQDPSVCSRCGLELAPALQADMEKYGFTEFMEVGATYDYHTVCNKNRGVTTVAEVTVNRYEIFDSADGYPAKDGYEWRIVEMQALFHEQNAKSYGSVTASNYEDYYTIELHDDTDVYDEETEISTFSVSYHGEIMEATERIVSNWSGWHYVGGRQIDICTVTWEFCVPKGYDGVVIGFRNAAIEWEDGTYLYDYQPEDFLLFRLSNQEEAQAADDGILAGSYSLYALEDSGEYIDNATLASLGMDGLVIITFNGDGTGVMSTEGEEVTFTYDDTTISDADGFTYEYVIKDGMLKVDVGNGQIFHCQKK